MQINSLLLFFTTVIFLINSPSANSAYTWKEIEQVGDSILDISTDDRDMLWVTGEHSTWRKISGEEVFKEIEDANGKPIKGTKISVSNGFDKLWIIDGSPRMWESTFFAEVYEPQQSSRPYKDLTGIASSSNGTWVSGLWEGFLYIEYRNRASGFNFDETKIEIETGNNNFKPFPQSMDYSSKQDELWMSFIGTPVKIAIWENPEDTAPPNPLVTFDVPMADGATWNNETSIYVNDLGWAWITVFDNTVKANLWLTKDDGQSFTAVDTSGLNSGLVSVAVHEGSLYVVTKSTPQTPGKLYMGVSDSVFAEGVDKPPEPRILTTEEQKNIVRCESRTLSPYCATFRQTGRSTTLCATRIVDQNGHPVVQPFKSEIKSLDYTEVYVETSGGTKIIVPQTCDQGDLMVPSCNNKKVVFKRHIEPNSVYCGKHLCREGLLLPPAEAPQHAPEGNLIYDGYLTNLKVHSRGSDSCRQFP